MKLLKTQVLVVFAAWLFLGMAPPGVPPPVPQIGAGHDAVILDEEMVIDIRTTTEAHEKFRRRVQVLTAKGIERFEVAPVFHAPGRRILSLHGSVTLPSGKVLKADGSQAIDAPAMASFELYSDSRYRSLRFPGVVPGAIIEYSYEVAMDHLAYLTTRFEFQEDVPVVRKSLTLSTTVSVPIRFSVTGASPEYSKSEGGTSVTHRWSVKDVEGFLAEPGASPEADLVPSIVFAPLVLDWHGYHAQASTWNGIARFYVDLAETQMRPGPEVARTAAEWTSGVEDSAEKTRRLFEFVQGKVRYVAIELGIGGWRPHANADVMRYQYGDCKDKATLLIAMLRSVGVEGYPVLIRTRDAGLVDPAIPSLAFNHAIVAIPSGSTYLFLDPTSTATGFGDLPWQDQGASALVIRPDGTGDFLTTPVHPPDRNGRRFQITAYVGLSGDLEGQLVVTAKGQRKARLADLPDLAPSDQHEQIAGLLAGLVTGAQLKQYKLEEPADAPDEMRVTIDFAIKSYTIRAGSIEIVKPHLIRLPATPGAADTTARRQPVFFRFLSSDIVETRLYLPPGRTLRKLPQEARFEGPGMSADTTYALSSERGRNIVATQRTVLISRREIPTEDYAAYRTFASELDQDETRALTLILEP